MPATQAELEAILHGAAFAPLTDRAFLRITGSDATRWLNGMVTNSIQALQPGEGNYNFLLNAQGRIQADGTIYREPGGEPTFLLETDRSQLEAVQLTLDRFIIMDDVELTPLDESDGLLLLGPQTAVILQSFLSRIPDTFKLETISMGPVGNIVLTTPATRSVPAFELHGPAAAIAVIHAEAVAQQACPISSAALEAFRILSGTPRYGTDIRNSETARDLPQETNQAHALHFSKGCYLGQEIVERIRSRGQVHKLFTRFRLQGDLPTGLPAPLMAEGKPVGELTSAALVPLVKGSQLLALGYTRRESLETGRELTYTGGTAIPLPASKPMLRSSVDPYQSELELQKL